MENSEAYRLLYRLAQDPAFRSSFDADPVAAARAAGLPGMAQELARDRADPMQTLELRESKSSLAGALMAAAAEGLGLVAASGLGSGDYAPAAVQPAPAAENVAMIGQAPPAEPVAGSPDAQLAQQAVQQAEGKSPAGSVLTPTGDPDDLQGELDDEDAGADEQDGSNEVEPDEGSDDEGSDDAGSDDEGSDDAGGDDEYDDAEDANDPSDDGTDDGSDGSDGSDDSDDSDDSNDSDDSDDSDDGAADSAGVAGDLSSAPDAYPGDNAPPEQVAAWMANEAQRRGLPPELPVMASLVESGMHNLDHGDADSVGLFQMRASIWDAGAYKGYQNNPELQLKWFLDQAEAVKEQRVAAGKGIGSSNYGAWIADVERPAAQYRGRYQLQLDDARHLLEKSAGNKPASGSAQNAQVLTAVDGSEAQVRADIVVEAKSFVGTPYVWGGTSPRGFDCSGFVQYVYKHAGVGLPRVSSQQASSGQRISLSQLKKGDLVAWDNSTRNKGADHIAIYLGNGRIAEAPRPGVALRVRNLGSNEGAWGVRVLGARRG
jgi:cell wall-associated NlpC family hydrolase